MVAKLYICYIQSLRCLNTVNFDVPHSGSSRSNFVHLKRLLSNKTAQYHTCHAILVYRAQPLPVQGHHIFQPHHPAYVILCSGYLLCPQTVTDGLNMSKGWHWFTINIFIVQAMYVWRAGLDRPTRSVVDVVYIRSSPSTMGLVDMTRTCFGDCDLVAC